MELFYLYQPSDEIIVIYAFLNTGDGTLQNRNDHSNSCCNLIRSVTFQMDITQRVSVQLAIHITHPVVIYRYKSLLFQMMSPWAFSDELREMKSFIPLGFLRIKDK